MVSPLDASAPQPIALSGRLAGRGNHRHQRGMRSERILLLTLAFALGVGCLLILLPFLPAMLWASILVYCTWPVYRGVQSYLGPRLAALLVTIVIAAIVLVPLVHLGLVAAKEARQSEGWVHDAMQNGLPPAPAFLARIPLLGSLITDFWNNSADDLGGAGGDLQPVLGTVAHSGLKLVLALTHGLVGIVVALFIAYFFYLSGAQIIARLRLLLVRIMNENRVEHLLGLMAATVRGVVFGILGTAAMQGVLYVIGFEIAGAPQALLLASIAGLVSIIPAGAVVIYVPVCLYLLATSHVLVSILLAVYCFVVVGGADSVVRPWLISRGAALPYVLTLIGVLGGAIAFGALGIFLGPVLLALGLAVAEEFAGVPRGAWREP
jgi:predicted PurR-regulated permease PerM